MKIICCGASGEVTGSCYWLRTQSASVLIDCGMFQGSRESEKRNRVPKGLKASQLDAVILTHAHLDHCGRLPLLVKAGFSGPIFATKATKDFCALILRDAAQIQAADLERMNRYRMRAGKEPVQPLFDVEDVEATLNLIRPIKYGEQFTAAEGLTVRPVDAGHMLGSCSLEVTAQENGHRRVVVFSGDLGPRGAPFMHNPEPFHTADYVFLESTYGDRDHKPLKETLEETADIIEKVVARRGKIFVPVFAVGRTQQLLYHIAAMFRTKRLKRFPIYLDSPMALEANKIYSKNQELFDPEAAELARSGQLVTDLASVIPCPTAEDSKQLNHQPGPMMVLAGSGMCTGGRILHHLRANLWKRECAVLFVGYQGDGSLGRQLIDGKDTVRIFGDPVAVRASIHTLGGYSSHAGQTELLEWLKKLAPIKPHVVLTHGEDRARGPLGKLISQRYRMKVSSPGFEEVLEID